MAEAPTTRTELLNRLADLAGLITDLHTASAALAMPQAVTMGLQWLRDDAVGVVNDALAAKEPA